MFAFRISCLLASGCVEERNIIRDVAYMLPQRILHTSLIICQLDFCMKHHNLPWNPYFRYMSLENLLLKVLQVSFAFCVIGAVSILKAFVTA